ncbi:TetR/AcrR family transcriptional regulator [Phenylobacterium sp. SCN 70-31]|uniref:TetR/AcrR family transcriptional regulator n=1 Tax=Phenylobacterium sp. SCN 70-31 TaxID=1660129 RepID=UPI0008692B14|nr:TetR/AcrR family transcriptional regulator [Phenylobacterium sp. SCN 70-31]ODT89433.1 MAG: TetR family transcriptional regulator [Phenylobacterium sp. SCN 70-31]
MDAGQPKFRRRKADRPDEIVSAALEVFAEKGFAAARLDDIARRAGVSKGAVYLYFETKEDVFRAVVDRAIAPNLDALRAILSAHPGPFPDLIRQLLGVLVGVAAGTSLGGVLKMVVGEARNFPELARIWHDELVAKALGAATEAIATAQLRGQVRAGDPRAYALQLVSPILMGVLWRETFVPVGARPFDLTDLAGQHLETFLNGILGEGVR